MLEHELLADEGILVLKPREALTAEDFETVAAVVDPYLSERGDLRGILIDAPTFPGWEDFAGFVSHMRFVREHHEHVGKVAVVSDSTFLSVAPKLASHFVRAEVRHFESAERDSALAWLREA